jgi:spermatogenesis-associated protein 2
MKDYLSLVAPNQRFYYPSTKDVLYNSILQKKSKEQFSLAKFSQAWEMLGMYAANLLSQPWRKEFREIRVNIFNNCVMKRLLTFCLLYFIKQLYSGAFKHQIEQQLIGAEDILMTMGYTLDIEYNRLVMQSILDPDRIVIVSRDCLLAKVEAQVIRNINFVLILLSNNSIVFLTDPLRNPCGFKFTTGILHMDGYFQFQRPLCWLCLTLH